MSNSYPLYQVYLAWSDTHCRIFISHWPELDLKILAQEQGLNNLGLLTPPLPIGIADYAADCLASEAERRWALLASAGQTVGLGVRGGVWRSWFTAGQEKMRRLTRTAGFANAAEGGNLLGPEQPACSEAGSILLGQCFRLVQKALKSLEPGALPEKFDWAGFKPRVLTVGDSVLKAGGTEPCSWADLAESEALGDPPVLKASKALEGEGESALPIRMQQVSGGLAAPTARAALSEILAGRVLTAGEVKAVFAARGLISEPIRGPWLPLSLQNILQGLALREQACLLPSVSRSRPGEPVCRRCGQSRGIKASVCEYCGRSVCYYCEECLNMGLARECLPLIAVPGPSRDIRQAEAERKMGGTSASVCLKFALTPAQRRAAEEVRQFWLSGMRAECLVWAVCGAGKTEVVFSVLAEALAGGGRVLYAIPRRDVVRELESRLRQAFPDYRVLGLYAGSSHRYAAADIYVATTHQALRFYQNFDLVILDEVDAYPYRESPLLHFAVKRARKPAGQTVYLSATPTPAMQQRALKGELSLVYIPVRHHGYPVPEPELLAERQLRYPRTGQELVLPPTVLELIYQSVVLDQVRLFIFVPAVRLAEQAARAINQVVEREERFVQVDRWWKNVPRNDQVAQDIPQNDSRNAFRNVAQNIRQNISPNKERKNWAESCHAGDPRRDQRRTGFAQGHFPILVTTTILERGITIAPVNVLVLFADAEKIFDEGALVQMAGRTGRTEAYPKGKVWLVGARVSPAMRQARARIQEMNRIARERGDQG